MKMGALERRILGRTEVRAAEGEEGGIEGTGVVFNSLSEDLGGWREQFAVGAFDESLRTDDIRVQWQHDPRYVFGRVLKGTAEVWADDEALRYRATPPDAQWARDAVESIRRGDVDQNSFAFLVEREEDHRWENRDGVIIRTVLRARLREVGPQTDPAYPDTSVALRSLEEVRNQLLPGVDQLALLRARRTRRSKTA